MRIKMFFLLTCAVLVFTLGACSSSQNASLTLTADDFAKETGITRDVVMGIGDTLTVTLASNASTGYSWNEVPAISNPPVLQQLTHKYIEPSAKTPVAGAPGKEEWTFKGTNEGATTLSFRYARPWESTMGLWQLKLNVTVKQ